MTLPEIRAGLHQIAFAPIALGIISIYLCFVLRALRWSVLLRPLHNAKWTTLLAPQLIGFAAVALFGRAADLARPYLVARRVGTPSAMQLGIYTIERGFDLGAAALLFSIALLLAPPDMAHRASYVRAGALACVATIALAAVVLGIRFRGAQLAAGCERLLSSRFPRFAPDLAKRVLELQHGFYALASARQFTAALVLSLLMWLGIACAYLEATHAFRAAPRLADMSFAGVMLLLAASLGASLLQLPVLGWFTQMAALAATIHALYGVPFATASTCAAVVVLITTLSVIPGGLVAARLQGETLRQSTARAESGM